ncbi:FAD binding domain-containing protein [Acuticoccus mangrovi]|uniref:FAD binding domain-containing protein n=1 Tax=Acuticoccus mangrovi TaxID=2796142 RepID=A0A934MGN6_9HYPH|nr:FAD binding domain-containing protein [Acuticoccus mangrovi]MBJ3775181.1 FAD binding domain-containing protein [Acuticoccus mangrovi]
MAVTVETYATLAEAQRAMAGGRARFLGGGTILMRALNEADPSISTIVRATDPALRQIRPEGGEIMIGAGVTMAELARHRDTAFLAPVARVIGGPQVRAAATVAGNLFAAAPYGDMAAALLALGATIETADGRRQPIEELMRPSGSGAGGLVAAVRVADPRGAFHFCKVSRVKPKGVSLISIAALLPRPGGRIERPRIVFNGMGPRPVRAAEAERALEGRSLDAAAIAAAARAAAEGFDPPDDALASAWYRREVAGVHLARLLTGIR